MDLSFAGRAPSIRVPRPFTLSLPRHPRTGLCIALAVLALLGGAWMLLRTSPFVAVEHVRITGVRGVDAGEVEAALSGAARHMSTLDVNVGALRSAVARFPVVRSLSVTTSFPHGLRIDVVEQLPVAALEAAGVRTAVAADGAVLGPGLLSDRAPLPALALTGSVALPLVARVRHDGAVRAELAVLGAAPRVLLRWVARVYTTSTDGLTVAIRDGLLIYFGNATRPHAKWLSAARVLADPSSAGATYIDVRAPERPAAGTTAAGGLEGTSTASQGGATDPTSAALANVLAEAVSGGVGAAAAAAPAASAPPAGTATSAGAATVAEPNTEAAAGASTGAPAATAAVAGSPSEATAAPGATGTGEAASTGTATSATTGP
jgi:cell division protein FtsQ